MDRVGLDWIIWHVTNMCNLECSYCFTSSSPKSPKPLEKAKLLQIADVINKSGVKLVTIIGGEPFTLPYLPEIVENLLDCENREVNIDTNGILIRRKWHHVYERVNRINISFDDVNRERHNSQRGGHNEVIDGINFLRDKNVPFGTNITITNRNFQAIRETAEFLLENGASIISFSRINPIGFGQATYSDLRLLPQQEEFVVTEVIDFYKKYKDKVKVLVTGFYNDRLFREGPLGKLPSCLCGDVKITINYDGQVYPCEAIQKLNPLERPI